MHITALLTGERAYLKETDAELCLILAMLTCLTRLILTYLYPAVVCRTCQAHPRSSQHQGAEACKPNEEPGRKRSLEGERKGQMRYTRRHNYHNYLMVLRS